MENIILSFNVIAPLFFLMVIGYAIANYTDLADKDLLKKANSLVFKVFLPCMLFKNIYQSNIREQMQGGLCFLRQVVCFFYLFFYVSLYLKL